MDDANDRFVCPQPMVWSDIHKALNNARLRRADPSIPPPPIPLILAASWDTPNLMKHLRWQETVTWAEDYGFADIIPELSKEQSYYMEG